MPKVIVVADVDTLDDGMSIYEQHEDGTATWTIQIKRGVSAHQFERNREMVEAVFEVMIRPAIVPVEQVAIGRENIMLGNI